MELHTDEGNFQGLKIVIAAGVNSKNLQVKLVKPTDQQVAYLVRNRLPVLVTSNGTQLFSANSATSLIFAESGNKGDAVKADQWMEWENSSLLPAVHRAVLAGKLDDTLAALVKAQLNLLEADLSNQYILGSNLTVVDVVVWSTIFPLVNCSDQTKALVTGLPKTMQWFDRLAAQPAFKDAVGALYKKSIKEGLKASVSAAPVPPSPAASTSRLLGLDKVAKPPADSPTEEEVAITAEEKNSAAEAWKTGSSNLPRHKKPSHPILPIEVGKNVLITSALPYVNNVPHLGNIIGCVLSADVYARFCRLRGYNTLYICGTDEYGTATETKAMAEGLTPLQICDKYNKLHTEIYKWFNIDFDYFGRTTTEQQTKIAQDIFWKLHENGHILKDSVEQLQCVHCNRFLADRFVEGTCPFCAYEDARGDQCDKCGKLINAPDLRNPRCKTCGKTPIVCSTEHLFLDLPTIAPQLEKFLDGEFESGIWTSNCKVITKSWLRDGLKPRCISRDLKWGTPVPLEGYTEKVFYVWYDAPIGYISITANYTSEWERWWKNPEQVSLYQFMAKDNVPFHSVIFPSSLIGTKQNWTMVNNLSATEYLNYEDTKFSKSRGTGVFGNDAQDTGIPSDIWRFYLLFVRPESQDSSFSWDDFLLKNNSELLNNLGNFIQRALAFVANNFKGVVPEVTLTEEDKELLAQVTRELVNYGNNLEKIRLRDAIRNILSISRLGNQFIQINKPWVLVKGTEQEKARAGSVVALAANMAALLSVMVQPYMPTISATIQQQVNLPAHFNVVTDKFVCLLPKGHKIGTPSPLFQKIEAEKIAELKKKFAGQQATAAAGSAPTASPEVIAALTEAVTKQGELVRQLKAAKAEKGAVNVEVAKLLDLKKELAAVSGAPAQEPAKGKKKGNQQKQQQGGDSKKNPPAASGQAAPAGKLESPEVIKQLMEQVSTQGNVVRDAKAAKADKAKIDAEVAKLLDLKRLLAVAMGQNPNDAAGGGKKKKGSQAKEAASNNPAPTSAPAANAAGASVPDSPEVVKQLLEQVTVQGNVVRDVKAAKADKAVIDAEVAKLLDLKKLLAVSMGQDPNEAAGGGSKKKKGKKK